MQDLSDKRVRVNAFLSEIEEVLLSCYIARVVHAPIVEVSLSYEPLVLVQPKSSSPVDSISISCDYDSFVLGLSSDDYVARSVNRVISEQLNSIGVGCALN